MIPSSWSLENYADDFNGDYYDNRINEATWQAYHRADICIESRQSDVIDIPFVVSFANKCGEPAMHMHLTPGYLLDKNRAIASFGKYENVFIINEIYFEKKSI